ncbi:hypothetical protein VTJ49DRAFT_7392 [Mycothermus thermophilus]|uniref:Amine oxidase domain-containing protein n=1 Tax=Humicola insolens TaxID=85995 RepID=A0ABR3VH50_HUMIN
MYTTRLRSLERLGACHGVVKSLQHAGRVERSSEGFRHCCSQRRFKSSRAVSLHIARDKSRPPSEIAVLGGGLTGLSTAWYLTRTLPDTRITIYDSRNRLGGWIETDEVHVRGADGSEGTVRFEHAARMIKPQDKPGGQVPRWDDLVFFDLLMSKGKGEERLSGFIYYPDHLVGPIPAPFHPFKAPLKTLQSIYRFFTEPLYDELIPSVLHSMRTNMIDVKEDLVLRRADMSVGEYMTKLFGRRALVDKMFSAIVHGITGGDLWETSMACGPFADRLVPSRNPKMPVTSRLVCEVDYNMMRELARDKATFELALRHLGSTAMWFRDGFATLPNAMADALKKNPKVTVKTGEPVTSLTYNDQLDKVAVTSSKENQPVFYDKVVSTIYAKNLAKLAGNQLPSLEKSTAVTIMLVNIWYPIPKLNFPYRGFGYLLPQALPPEANPECLLGVIFDSDREYPLPTPSNRNPASRGADSHQGTKLTVMMGGHYWSDLPPSFIPDKSDAQRLALAAVQRHLNLPPELAELAHTQATLCVDCIPQHLVGHASRMAQAHGELEWAFKGRLAVAGQSYTNPGVLPSLRAGRDVAVHIAREHWPHEREADRRSREEVQKRQGTVVEQDVDPVGETGLERFTRLPTYTPRPTAYIPLRYAHAKRVLVDWDGTVLPVHRKGTAKEEGEQKRQR